MAATKKASLGELLVEIKKLNDDRQGNDEGRRPVYEGAEKFQSDPHWRDLILFYEYFHGDNGAGLGSSNQTGWSGEVAKLIQIYGLIDGKKLLESGRSAGFVKGKNVQD